MTSTEASLLHEASVLILQFSVDKLKIMQVSGDSISFFGVNKEEATNYTLIDYISQTDAAALHNAVALFRTTDQRPNKIIVNFDPSTGVRAGWVSVDLLEVVAQGVFVRAVLTHCNEAVGFQQSSDGHRSSALEQSEGGSLASAAASADHIDEDELKCCCSAKPLFECDYCTSRQSPMCLGTGSFAKIYRACWLGTTVAVKHYCALGPGRMSQARSSFEKELAVFRSMRHPNMIRFFGMNTHRLSLVIEVAEGGSLCEYIKLNSVKEFANTVWPDHMRIAIEITCGLLYLHARSIAHGDIKSFNILMTSDGMAKISDFGTAVALGSGSNKDNTPLSCAWSSPERLKGGQLTSEADIYSLGIVFWELCTCSLPYDDFKGGIDELKQSVIAGERPLTTGEMDSYLSEYTIPPLMVTLFKLCWTAQPHQRPSGKQVYETLCNVKAHWKCGSCGCLNPPEKHGCDSCTPERYEDIVGTIYTTRVSSGQQEEGNLLQDVRASDLVPLEETGSAPLRQIECSLCRAQNSSQSVKCRVCEEALLPISNVQRVVQDSSNSLVRGIEESLLRRTADLGNSSQLEDFARAFQENPNFYNNWCCDMCQAQNDESSIECEECHALRMDHDILERIKSVRG